MAEIISSRTLADYKIIQVKELAIDDEGQILKRISVEKKDAVAVLPVLDNGNVVLVKQFRGPAGEAVWELPAGGIEDGETPEDAGWRELLEETGYSAREVTKIYSGYSSPGITNEKIHIYKATKLTQIGEQQLDKDEGTLEVKDFSVDELQKMMEDGAPMSLFTIIGIQQVIMQQMESQEEITS